MNVLEIKQLHKKFSNKEVLTGLDLQVPQNSVFGFVGPNGAGKTTTMKIILGLLKADQGIVTVCGEKVVYGDTKTNRHIGYLPDVPEFYGYMKAMEYLKLCGEITGLSKKQIINKSHELLELVGLSGETKKISSYSRGMKQRLGIAQALLNEPKLLICDEPTSALDPIGRRQILDLLLDIKGKTTIIFSTHILSDVERVCDNVAVLHQGKLALKGTLTEIKNQASINGFKIQFATIEQLSLFVKSDVLEKYKINIDYQRSILTVNFDDTDQDGFFLLELLAKLQIMPVKFEKIQPSLENIFTEVVR